MSQERNHELMEAGTQATLVAGYVRDVVDDMMRTKITLLMAQYRNGKIDHDMMIGRVAEIAALDDLMAELENRQTRANIAAQKELGRGTTQ